MTKEKGIKKFLIPLSSIILHPFFCRANAEMASCRVRRGEAPAVGFTNKGFGFLMKKQGHGRMAVELRFRFPPGASRGQSPEMQKVVHLAVQVLEGSRVIKHMIGPNGLFSQGQLRPFACVHFLFTPPALPGHPLQPYGPRRIYKQKAIAKIVPSCFHHDRRIQDDQRHMRIVPGFFHLGMDALTNPRMRQRLQRLAFRWVGEDDGGQAAAVDLASFIHDAFAPAGDDAGADVRIVQSGLPQLIAGNDARSMTCESSRHLTLAAADAAE
jgi:hypothetical protein